MRQAPIYTHWAAYNQYTHCAKQARKLGLTEKSCAHYDSLAKIALDLHFAEVEKIVDICKVR